MNPDIFAQAFAYVSQYADEGSQGTGEVADWLIHAGLSAAAIAQILNGVATSAAATPAHVAYVQNELAYLNQSGYVQPTNNAGLWIALGLAGLVFVATRD